MTEERIIVDSFDGLHDKSYDGKTCRTFFPWRRRSEHEWSETKTYVTEHGKFYEQEMTIGTCRHCKKRIVIRSCGRCKPSEAGFALLHKVVAELGKPPIAFDPQRGSPYGSGYFCELPVAVSDILDRQGEEAARAFIRSQFDTPDGCSGAMRIVQGLR